MFERFTDRSRRVVVLAQEEARILNHNYIGTEHLLLGLLHEGRGTAAKVLASADVTLGAARRDVELLIGRGEQAPGGHILFTPRAKKCLELSLREALQLGDNYIGTGHLLLGIIHEGDGVAMQILSRLGADIIQLRERVTRALEDDPEIEGGPEDVVRVRLRPQGDPIRPLLDTIDDRLGSIERHLGIAPPEPPARSASEVSAGSPGPAEVARLNAQVARLSAEVARLSAEVARLSAEVARLRDLLREHDIDPGEPEAPGMVTG